MPLAFFLLLVLQARAQVTRAEFSHEVPFETRPEVHVANATIVRPGWALLCAHTIHWGRVRGSLRIAGRPAVPVVVGGDLVLARVEAAVPAAQVIAYHPDSEAGVEDGQRLLHRYVDRSGKAHERWVTWRSGAYVEGGFDEGMSGSGLFDARGDLVAIAESLNGFSWGPLHVAAALSEIDL